MMVGAATMYAGIMVRAENSLSPVSSPTLDTSHAQLSISAPDPISQPLPSIS
jgi:hypothetical protein